MSDAPIRGGRRLIQVVLVIMLLVVGVSVLLPSLSRSRELTKRAMMRFGGGYSPSPTEADLAAGELDGKRSLPAAKVKAFLADIDLQPKLSVGTAEPENIYEVRFHAKIQALSPVAGAPKCRMELPLPPTLISLADLTITANGDASDDVSVAAGGPLVWRGSLDANTPTELDITYSAMGKGVYVLEKPAGEIIDTFETKLTANGSNVRMMELSLQPTEYKSEHGKTLYAWKYNRLVLGQPIQLDVLGIAPMDKLGELTWLAPVSLVIFGALLTIMVLAYRPEKLEIWMSLLIVGTFAGVYPLMYFAQEYVDVHVAAVLAGAIVLAVIAVRAVTLFGRSLGLLGVTLLAGVVLALTVFQALRPPLQGVLLTAEAIFAFVLAMIMLPRAQRVFAKPPQSTPPPLPERGQV